MNASIQRVWTGFDALTLRERALICVSVLAVLWLVWDWTLRRSVAADVEARQREVAALQQRINSEVARQVDLQRAIELDPNKQFANEAKLLAVQIAELDGRLESIVGGFVAPTMVPVLLEDVLAHHAGVEMLGVTSLPVEMVRQKDSSEATPGLYRHVLRVELTGGYFAVRDYLKELETGPWHFSWRSLRYRVEDYPHGLVTLELTTLSRDRNWLGV
jgi:MSHA biogenesis protein MshJ